MDQATPENTPYPATKAPTPVSGPDPAERPADVVPLSCGRLRAVMEASRLSYKEDGTGNFIGVFAGNADVPFDVYFSIAAQGDAGDILSVRMFSAKVVAPEARARAMAAANKFNNDMRWPKTYISSSNDEGEEPRLVGEEQLDTESGVGDAFLVEFLRGALGHGWTMFKTLHTECF